VELEKVFAHVEEKEEELLDLLCKAIAIDNNVPPGHNYHEFADLFVPYFEAAGLKTEKVIVPEELWRQIPTPGLDGERVNLVAYKNTGKEPVTLYGHVDTVPVDDKWTFDPFGCEIRDGKVYGRGTSDMKGSIVALAIALKTIAELDLPMHFDPNCVLCTDEEIGVYPGVYHLAKEGYVKGHVICLDGSQDPRESLASAGSADIYVTTRGRSCHSGMNFLGVNALEEMIPIMNELMELKKLVEVRESAIDGPLNPKAPSRKMTPMFNLDVIHSGTKSNIVPAECTLIINRRYIPEEKFEDVMAEIYEAIEKGKAKSNALAVDVKVQHSYPAAKYNPGTPYAKRMKQAKMLVQGYKEDDFAAYGVAGSTDMSFVQQVLNTEDIVMVGAGRSGSNAHGADEFVYISDLKALVKELIYYLCF
jgi:succinyl-diaminopimelate desuccinylase